LVYVARHLNLAISVGMLLFQIALSFALIYAMSAAGWPVNYQAAGPAIALMLSLALTSLIKAGLLRRVLHARVSAWRWTFIGALAAGVAMGTFFTRLPKQLEWLQLLVGEPAIVAAYLFVLLRWAFKAEDRALFKKLPGAAPEPLPA
jgi:hypothetical protein